MPTNNPAKTIFGAAYDVEFGNLATAIASKPDNLTTASFLNVNVTGSTIPANGIYLPATNTLGFSSNTTQRATVNSTGAWTINAPTAGTALTVNVLAGAAGIFVAGPSGQSGSVYIAGNALGTASALLLYQDGAGANHIYGSNNAALDISTNGTQRMLFAAAGNVTVNAPSSGTALTVNGVVGAKTLSVTDAVNFTAVITRSGSSGNVAYIGGDTGSSLDLGGGALAAIRINTSGNVTINAPSSGTALTVNGGGVSATTFQISAGAAAAACAAFDNTNASFGGYFQWTNSGTANGFLGSAAGVLGATLGDTALRAQGQLLLASGGGNTRITIGSSGNVTIAAPSSGVGLSVNSGVSSVGTLPTTTSGGLSARIGILISAPSNATDTYFAVQNTGGPGTLAGDALIIARSDIAANIIFLTGSTAPAQRMVIGGSGNVTVNAPTSGTALQVNGLSTGVNTALFQASTNAAQGQISFGVPAGTVASLIWDNGTTLTGVANSVAFGGPASVTVLQTGTTNRLTVGSSGNVTVAAPSSGVAATINGVANATGLVVQGAASSNTYAAKVLAGTGSGSSFGMLVAGGTTSVDYPLVVQNQALSATFLQIFGDGHGTLGPSITLGLSWAAAGNVTINAPASGQTLTVNNSSGAAFEVSSATTAPTVQGWGPTAAALVDMTPDTGTFTITYKDNAGANTLGTGTARWVKSGNFCLLFFPTITVANAAGTDFTATGLPAVIQPTRTQLLAAPTGAFQNNSVPPASDFVAQVTAASGTVTFWKDASSGGWSAAGTKGIVQPFSVVYMLN